MNVKYKGFCFLDIFNCTSGLSFFTSFKTYSSEGSVPKACHFVTGFGATLGASLDEFAGDVMAILELTINIK